MSIVVPYDYEGNLEVELLKVRVWSSCINKHPHNYWEIVITDIKDRIIYSQYSSAKKLYGEIDECIGSKSNIKHHDIMYLVNDIIIDHDENNDFDPNNPEKYVLNPKIKIKFNNFKDLYDNITEDHHNGISECTYNVKIHLKK